MISVSLLLQHKSASEERLTQGTGVEVEPEGEPSSAEVVQEVELMFGFEKTLPNLKIREIALDWNREAFKTKGSDDATGITVWSASLLLTRWMIDLKNEFHNKSVCELGSGCGLSGIAMYKYTNAAHVVLTDVFEHTLDNLRHNVALNDQSLCAQCGLSQKFTVENPSGKLLQCARCGIEQYCSRACQKQAWKSHKPVCLPDRTKRSLSVKALDWAQPPDDTTYDVVIGSDLVYHRDIVPILAQTLNRILSSGGIFYHVASDQRSSLEEFSNAMAEFGFTCTKSVAPESHKMNPLVEQSTQFFDLHFNEMDDTYWQYTFRRTRRAATH